MRDVRSRKQNFKKTWDSENKIELVAIGDKSKGKSGTTCRPVGGVFDWAMHWLAKDGPEFDGIFGKPAIPKVCRAYDWATNRMHYTQPMADSVVRLLKRHKIKSKREDTSEYSVTILCKAKFDQIADLLWITNSSLETRVNPHMLELSIPKEGMVSILIEGCPAHDILDHKPRYKHIMPILDPAAKSSADLVKFIEVRSGTITGLEDIAQNIIGTNSVANPYKGGRVLMTYDSSEAPATKYGVQNVGPHKIKPDQITETLGKYRVMLALKDAKSAELDGDDFKKMKFQVKKLKTGEKVLVAIMNLYDLFQVASCTQKWVMDGEDVTKRMAWCLTGTTIELKVTTLQEGLVPNFLELYYPDDAQEIYDTLHKFKYLSSEGDSNDEGDDFGDDFDDDDDVIDLTDDDLDDDLDLGEEEEGEDEDDLGLGEDDLEDEGSAAISAVDVEDFEFENDAEEEEEGEDEDGSEEDENDGDVGFDDWLDDDEPEPEPEPAPTPKAKVAPKAKAKAAPKAKAEVPEKAKVKVPKCIHPDKKFGQYKKTDKYCTQKCKVPNKCRARAKAMTEDIPF